MKLTAIIEREGDGYVALCPELDVASQGDTIEQARDNLQEALELFFECASADEPHSRLKSGCSSPKSRSPLGKQGVVGRRSRPSSRRAAWSIDQPRAESQPGRAAWAPAAHVARWTSPRCGDTA